MPRLYLFCVFAAVEIGGNDDWVPARWKSNRDIIALVRRSFIAPCSSLVPRSPFGGETSS